MNARATQLRFGASNLADLISFSANDASFGSPVSLVTTFVDVTSPEGVTYASTTTRPCLVPPSANAGFGVLTKAKSVLQPAFLWAAGEWVCDCDCERKREAIQPMVPSGSSTLVQSSM